MKDKTDKVTKELPLNKSYPMWVCYKCGEQHGNKSCGIATWHPDTCGVCGKHTSVTEPRDFGHLKEGWDK